MDTNKTFRGEDDDNGSGGSRVVLQADDLGIHSTHYHTSSVVSSKYFLMVTERSHGTLQTTCTLLLTTITLMLQASPEGSTHTYLMHVIPKFIYFFLMVAANLRLPSGYLFIVVILIPTSTCAWSKYQHHDGSFSTHAEEELLKRRPITFVSLHT